MHPTFAVRCSFVVVPFFFPTATNFLRERQSAEEHTHPFYVPHMTRTLPGQNQGDERFALLYTHTVPSPPLPGARAVSIVPPLGYIFDPYTHDNN